MHDPKIAWGDRASAYQMDATPGRHTANFGPGGFPAQLVNVLGLCMMSAFGFFRTPENDKRLVGFFNGVTGWDYTWDDMLKSAERVMNIRHAFNLREGISELKWPVNPRIIGKPPQTAGPLAGVTADIEAQVYWRLGALDWDRVTTKPSKAKLLSLGLDDVAKDL